MNIGIPNLLPVKNSFSKNVRENCWKKLLLSVTKMKKTAKCFILFQKILIFLPYFTFMGFEILVHKDSGVAMLSNIVNENISSSVAVNRFRFRKIESIVLCCLWTLLSDRLHRGSLDKVIKITLSDLNMELEKYDFKKPFDKGPLDEILKLFRKFNLIGTSGEIGDEDFTIILYPSLQFSLNENEFVSFVKDAENRMKGINNDVLESDDTLIEESDADESEIDSFNIEIE